jgi:hypothetical protein
MWTVRWSSEFHVDDFSLVFAGKSTKVRDENAG